MFDQFERLVKRARMLGNHHLKYIWAIERNARMLKERLGECNQLDKVHLFSHGHDLEHEMNIIAGVCKDEKEKLNLLGCYYSIQVLLLNLGEVDLLRKTLIHGANRIENYTKFMLRMGKGFQQLTSKYMSTLLKIFRGHDDFSDFVITSVGTRADQDDIDVGVIIAEKSKKKEINDLISKLNNEMMRRASCLHFHLSEHVGEKSYSATIPEYLDLLDRQIQDFVIITEMLGASPILGNINLFKQFQKQVAQRYYYSREGHNKYHEGYLRGILGEMRSLLLQHVQDDRIHPKNDALRLIKGFISVGKSVFNIEKVNAWEILEILKDRDPARKEVYKNMRYSLGFVEIFRYLYQLFIVQEEEIFLNDQTVFDNLQFIAELMGYKNIGVVKNWENMLVHYYEYVNLAKESGSVLLADVRRQLSFIGTFPNLLNRVLENPNEKFNLAMEFTREARFFRGTKFWDDVIEIISNNQEIILKRFIDDLLELDGHARLQILRSFAKCGIYAVYPIIQYNVMLGRFSQIQDDHGLFLEFNSIFLETIDMAPNISQRIVRIFNYYPKLIHDYLVLLPEQYQRQFTKLLDHEIVDPEGLKTRDKLRHYCWLHYSTSRYFTRYFYQLVEKYPEYIAILNDTEKLEEMAKGILAEVENLESCVEKKRMLGDYYNTEFIRIGLDTLNGVDIRQTNQEFTEFCDNYLQALIDICKKEVEEELGKTVATDDLLAIYATGGYAREQAFNDDYDLIFLLDSKDPAIMDYAVRVVSKFNSQIIKQGVLPHYRFADHFGNYVTRVFELENFFSSNAPGLFIDKSQVLSSRLVVGSDQFERMFEKRIIGPFIFDKCDEYMEQMVEEIQSRHKQETKPWGEYLSLKECAGGLRDIEMLLLIYKAKYKIRQHLSDQFMNILMDVVPANKEQILILADGFNYLKKVRDIYRILESAGDDLSMATSHKTAVFLGFQGKNGKSPAKQLFETIYQNTGTICNVIDYLIKEIS